MSKWAEVTLLTRTVYAVELEENETIEDAERYALEDHIGAAEVVARRLAKNDAEAGSIRRHADEELSI